MPRNKKPIIVAMVGVVGSGKSWAAKYLARLIDVKVVDENGIRVALRAQGKGYNLVDGIADKIATAALKHSRSVILDGDFVGAKNQKRLKNLAKKTGTKVFQIRTFCDRDIMIGRLLNAQYSPKSFFGGASSDWQGQNKGAVVALREMWRRTPHHYKWLEVRGGRWEARKLPIKFLAKIDTGKNWKPRVKAIAKRLQ